ncbi:MAG: hypothetical protein ACJA2X_000331 [Halocynthiibacter sp.]|jgi:hypothetical protein
MRKPQTKKGGAVMAPPFEMYRSTSALEKRLQACSRLFSEKFAKVAFRSSFESR